LDTVDGIKLTVDILKPLIERIWHQHERKRIQKESEVEEIQAVENEIKNNTYYYLYKRVFFPLRLGIVKPVDSYYFIPVLRFDPSNVCDSDNWEEGHKHLVKDIYEFDPQFSWIKENLIQYNNDLEIFEGKQLEELVSNYIEENGFTISNTVDQDPSNNTFLIKILIDPLKEYWTTKLNFRLVWHNNLLKINDIRTIASGTDENKTKIEDCINNLKSSEEILRRYYNLADYYNKILQSAEDLSREIGKKVVIKIEKGSYKTTCDECFI
jgi:hypothetical protein